METKLQFDFATTQQIIQLIAQIDQFKGEWKHLDQAQNRYLKALRQIATVQSIGSSNRIEGNTLTDAEVDTLIKNLKIAKLESRDEQEVMGYYDALETLLAHPNDIALSIYQVHGLHQVLLKYSTKDHRHSGQFKKMSNQVVATYPDGTARTIFKTTEPFLTEKEMQELVEWTNLQFKTQELHPLITIGVFIYEFLSIHPYQDGNGRLSRLLTTLLLLQQGYTFVQYISLEHLIEQDKAAYYQALMSGQKNRNQPTEKIDQWMLFFLKSLHTLMLKLSHKITEINALGAYLNDRQKTIFQYIQVHQPVKFSDITTAFPDYNPASIKKDLLYLTESLVLSKIGDKKGTIYIVKIDD